MQWLGLLHFKKETLASIDKTTDSIFWKCYMRVKKDFFQRASFVVGDVLRTCFLGGSMVR
jgi:hypothetical protein